MPERLDQVPVAINGGEITLTWDTRQALMRRLLHIQETARLRASFDAVGATRPVELNQGQRNALLSALENWSRDGSYEPMPKELTLLRAALADDLNEAE
jgi:hypothetical protein